MYPGQHGILSNNMYDRERDRRFYLFDVNTEEDQTRDPAWWTGHVPFWITATKEGPWRFFF